MRGLALIACAALGLALALGGTAPLGRALLSVGLPGPAMTAFDAPDWRGVAAFRSGDFAAAAEAFEAAGDPYNLGVALTHKGDYAAALEAFDLAAARGHSAARANFDVVAAFYAGLGIEAESLALFPPRKNGAQMDSHIARGNARAAGSGSKVTNTNTMLGLAELDSRGQQGVRRVFDDKFIVADERWLEQLSDVPGRYLKARIAHEHKRRETHGLSLPAPEDAQ